MSSVSSTILATSVFLTTLAGLGAGYLMTPPPERSGDSRPIVDPEAWNRSAPQTVQARMTPATYDAAETQGASADAPQQRGWQSTDPNAQADSGYKAELVGLSDSYTVEPLDGAGSSDKGSSSIVVLNKSEADRVWDTWSSAGTGQSGDTPPAPVSH